MTLLFSCVPAIAGDNLIQGGDFEQGLSGWHPFWSRDQAGSAVLDRDVKHGGLQAVRVEHRGPHDWSLGQERWLDVQPGQIYELAGWVRVRGRGVRLCLSPSGTASRQ